MFFKVIKSILHFILDGILILINPVNWFGFLSSDNPLDYISAEEKKTPEDLKVEGIAKEILGWSVAPVVIYFVFKFLF